MKQSLMVKSRYSIMTKTKVNSSLRYILPLIVLPILLHENLGIFSKVLVSASQHATSKVPLHERKTEAKDSSISSITIDKSRKKLKLIQVQVVHRHGDRTPITPMRDEEFWSKTLPSPSLLEKIASGTIVKRADDKMAGSGHAAAGRGPFGKLTQLGLFQMVEVGSSLREQLHLDEEEDDDGNHSDDEGHIYIQKGRLFSHKAPLHPNKIVIKSTDFPRTLQSVQALLVGLFPDGLPHGTKIEIDARHTDILIPDPQPRLSVEQAELERKLSQRQHLLEREAELKTLSQKISQEIRPFVGEDASSVSFGIGEEGDHKLKERPLSWSQLSEIMTCLKVRGLLPDSITTEEYEMATSHSAWKWFENLRYNQLAYLAMKPFMNFIMDTLHDGRKQSSKSMTNDEISTMYIYSAHDSSLIGLMCAFRLQQPSQWPEYGSYLKIELFEADPISNTNGEEKEYFVRFSLNNNVLKSAWGLGEGDYLEMKNMIPLHHLNASIKSEHGH